MSKQDEVIKFYKDAFVAESAEIVHDIENYKITAIVKINTGDSRGVIYQAVVVKNQ